MNYLLKEQNMYYIQKTQKYTPEAIFFGGVNALLAPLNTPMVLQSM